MENVKHWTLFHNIYASVSDKIQEEFMFYHVGFQ